MVVQRSIAARGRFEFVEKVHHHFVHWQIIGEHHLAAEILHIDLHAALLVAQRHHIAHVFLWHQDGGGDNRLQNGFHRGQIRQFRRIFHFDMFASLQNHFIHHGRRGGNQVHIELALQAFLHDFQVQQAQEAAAEAEAQRLRHFRLEFQRSVVELQFFQRVAQGFVIVAFHGIQAGEHLALHFFEAGQRLGSGVLHQRYRVAHFGLPKLLHAGDEEAHFSCFKLLSVH